MATKEVSKEFLISFLKNCEKNPDKNIVNLIFTYDSTDIYMIIYYLKSKGILFLGTNRESYYHNKLSNGKYSIGDISEELKITCENVIYDLYMYEISKNELQHLYIPLRLYNSIRLYHYYRNFLETKSKSNEITCIQEMIRPTGKTNSAIKQDLEKYGLYEKYSDIIKSKSEYNSIINSSQGIKFKSQEDKEKKIFRYRFRKGNTIYYDTAENRKRWYLSELMQKEHSNSAPSMGKNLGISPASVRKELQSLDLYSLYLNIHRVGTDKNYNFSMDDLRAIRDGVYENRSISLIDIDIIQKLLQLMEEYGTEVRYKKIAQALGRTHQSISNSIKKFNLVTIYNQFKHGELIKL